MNTTRWYTLAVAALIAAVYVSTQCRERYVLGDYDYVIDTWTGKVTHTNGEPVAYEIGPCCEGAPVEVMGEPPYEIQPVTNQIPEITDDCCEGDAMEQFEAEVDPATGHYKDLREE